MSVEASDPRRLAAVAALAVLPLLPFLGAAFAIDAPVFLAVSNQILAHPADPFGFDMIWDPLSPHVAEFNHNPPLLSYYLAPWIALAGERETVLHAAVLVFPLTAALAFAGVARRLCGEALRPAALLVVSPAFVLLASTLMLDVPMLAFQLLAVYALLRAMERGGAAGWELAAGTAAAAAGLTKYAGFSTAPLLAAAVVLWPAGAAASGRARAGALLRAVGVPLAVWTLWAVYTRELYGAVHFAGGVALVGQKRFDPGTFWNHTFSVPVWYGAALLFPIAAWLARLRRDAGGTELAVVGLVVGIAGVQFVLPGGEPERRVALGIEEAALGAVAFAGACTLWGRALWPPHFWPRPEDRFCAVWLGGTLVFSLFVNWHVNAADALLAAPPALVWLFRDGLLRPGRRAGWIWIGVGLVASLALLVADVRQRDVYREVVPRIVREIGDQPGARWFVGHWGWQYYLEREGFRAVVPAQYEASYGRSELEPGDWLASARNVSQLDVSRNLDRFAMRPVGRWREADGLPLHVTNPDAGAGFYSHQAGHVPFAWSRDAPLEEVVLLRVGGRRGGR